MTAKASKPEMGCSEATPNADLDDVSDTPEFTADEMAKAKPFAEAFPELAASAKRVRGRQRLRRNSSSACGSTDPSSRRSNRKVGAGNAASTKR